MEPVGFQIKNGGLGALPAGLGFAHLVELVEHPMYWIDDERVPVAAQVEAVAPKDRLWLVAKTE
jgi:hypothetical protein